MLEKSITEELKKEFRRRIAEESLPRIRYCLDLLSEEQIWYKANENTNSVGNLVLHLEGNIRQYILTGIAKGEDNRNRDQEFNSENTFPRAKLIGLLEETVNEALAAIEDVRPDMLTTVRPVQCFQETILSMMIHVMEHTSYHTGQIALQTKLMVNEDLGFYSDLPL